MTFEKTFKIASFNCFNLVRPGVLYYNKPAYSEEEYREKRDWSAQLLERTQADLVGFQEVFHEEALKDLVARVPTLTGGTVVALGANREENEIAGTTNPAMPRARMPKVGLATTLEVLETAEIKSFPSSTDLRFPDVDPVTGEETLVELPLRSFQRPVLKARVMLPNRLAATVFVAHLKSKRLTLLDAQSEDTDNPLQKALGAVRSLVIRAAEAAALRSLVLEVVDDTDSKRGEPVILLGGLNDSDTAISTQVVCGGRPWTFAPFLQRKHIWDTFLYNVHGPQAEQTLSGPPYSLIHDGQYEVLDHIMLSHDFHWLYRDNIGSFQNAHIFNDHLVDAAQLDEETSRIRNGHGVPVVEVKLKDQRGTAASG